MKDKKSDIIAVARLAKVSPSTVSRSFNHPDLVKATTRKRIDRAVRKLGYIRNRAAQTIHGIRSGTIGLIVPTVDHAIFAELIQSFSEAVEEKGFTILLATHGYSLDREYALVRKLLEHRVDGMALIGVEHAPDTYALLAQQNIPAILLWNYAENTPVTCIGSDNHLAGALIGAHIAQLAHKNIAAIFPPLLGNDRASNRLAGASEALAAGGCQIAAEWHAETPYSVNAAKDAAVQLLSAQHRPTAIVCGNDVLAWGALHAAASLGLRVPQDVSVTGIGDFKGSAGFEPALTTVRIPARKIGIRAAHSIAASIVSPDAPSVNELVAPELVIRATSGTAPN